MNPSDIRQSLYQCLENSVANSNSSNSIELFSISNTENFAISLYIEIGSDLININLFSGEVQSAEGNDASVLVPGYKLVQSNLTNNNIHYTFFRNLQGTEYHFLVTANSSTGLTNFPNIVKIRKEIKYGNFLTLLSTTSTLTSGDQIVTIYKDTPDISNGRYYEADNNTYVQNLYVKTASTDSQLGSSTSKFKNGYFQTLTTDNIINQNKVTTTDLSVSNIYFNSSLNIKSNDSTTVANIDSSKVFYYNKSYTTYDNSNKTEIANHDWTVGLLNSYGLASGTDISQIKQDIETNASDITNLKAADTELTKKIETNTASITSVSNNLTTNYTLKTEFASLSNRVGTNETSISDLQNNKQNKNDSSLATSSKTIVEAINEILSSLNLHVGNKENPHNVTKSQLDLDKVVNEEQTSTATENGTKYFTSGGAFSLQQTLQSSITSIEDDLTSFKSTTNSHISNKNNPHGVTKAQVGLGSVVNQSQSSSPTSGSSEYFTSGGAYTLQQNLNSAISSSASSLQTKIDEKQNKNDTSLSTTDKTVVGSINELKQRLDGITSIDTGSIDSIFGAI